jgi:hypothetical protein
MRTAWFFVFTNGSFPADKNHPMKKYVLLVLLVIPSVIFADSIVQNFSFYQDSGPSSGALNRIQSPVGFAGFSSALGTLTRVDFSFTAAIDESCMDNNQYSSSPVFLTSYISGSTAFSFFGGSSAPELSGPGAYRSVDPQLVAPNAWYGMSAHVDLAESWSFTNPGTLDYFQGSSLSLTAAYLVIAQSWAGSNRIQGGMDFTLTYNFTATDGTGEGHLPNPPQVPDAGATIGLLGLALGACGVLRKRF